jgi:hypothetical protein
VTEQKQEGILRKVRALYAKAASTNFPEEKELLQAKADQLMEAYALETWMIDTGQDAEKSKLIVRRDFDMTWWDQLGTTLDWDAKSQVWWLFDACARHCRCYVSGATISWGQNNVPVYGMAQDLDYLDLLFTDLFTQLFGTLRPKFDPKKTLGHNICLAREAGMRWSDVAVWSGHPEWYDALSGKYKDGGRMKREYLNHLKSVGRENERIAIHGATYVLSYLNGFNTRIRERMRAMRKDSESSKAGSGMELAVRDIHAKAQEAMYLDFPELRPHADGCSCKDCKKRKAVVRRGRQIDYKSYATGSTAGDKARIVSNSPGLKGKKEIGS